MTIKTTGEVKETMFPLPVSAGAVGTTQILTEFELAFTTIDPQCSSEMTWSRDDAEAKEISSCLARYALYGAGVVVRNPENIDGLTYVSETDSVVVYTTGSLLSAALSPQPKVRY